ncbi:MAG: hypothetical protein ABEJ87_05525 [Candidatus Nanohalobium sp.]
MNELTRTGFIFLGTIGGTIYLSMAIFYARIVENMREDKQTAIAKFFLKDRALKAFKTLITSGLVLVATLLLEVYGIATGNTVIATVARIIYPFPMIGLAYFSYTLQKVTGKSEKQS